VARTGDELGVELYDLWFAGARRLPALATEFQSAATQVSGTFSGENAYWRPAELSGPYGVARAAWASFRDDVYEILAETTDNLDRTGDALTLAAREYAKTDAVAAARLEQLKQQNAGVTIPASAQS
jgi:hypothetical protein